MEAGAKSVNRLVPPLIAHVPILAGASIEQTRKAMREHVSTNPKNAEFANMFRAAGFDEVDNGEWSDRMIDAIALYGDQDQIIEGLKHLRSIGASEIIASPIPFGDNIQASIKYTLEVLAKGQEVIDQCH
jgi:alkanesulfonate monooxygenase SsuD/methylene tetrahydromethanopterin reductase-like flavin-dependent oxidoreductase (luciferase family)